MYKINKIDFWCATSFLMVCIFMTGYTCPIIKDMDFIYSILLIMISSIYLGAIINSSINTNRKNK